MMNPPRRGPLDKMLRSFGAIFAGCVAAGILIMIVEVLGHAAFPPPEKYRDALKSDDMKVREAAIKEYLPQAPVGALLAVAISWGVGTTAGSALAVRLARRKHRQHGLIVGCIMMGCGIMMLVVLPHPTWMTVLGILVFPAATWTGVTYGQRRMESQQS